MRIEVNASCNVCTGEHSTAFRHADGRVSPQITVPGFRLRMTINEAFRLSADLKEAAQRASDELEKGGE
jgi:hypothetical protein